MNSRRDTFRLGALIFLFAVLLNVQAQQPQAPVQPRTVAPPQAQQQPQPQQQQAQAPKIELKFAIIGDTGTGTKPQYEIGQKLSTTHGTFPFEFVIMLGDNMYGGESAKDFQNKFEKP